MIIDKNGMGDDVDTMEIFCFFCVDFVNSRLYVLLINFNIINLLLGSFTVGLFHPFFTHF